MSAHRSPQEERAARKSLVARTLVLSMLHHGGVGTVVAAMIGVTESRWRQWTDPAAGCAISFADVLALPPLVLRDLLALAAEQLGLELVEKQTASDDVRVASLARCAGDALSSLAITLADGTVTRAEAAELEQDAALLSAQCQGVIALCRRAKADGVVKVDA